MEHSIDLKLFNELFAPKSSPAMGIVRDYEKSPQKASTPPILNEILSYEPEKRLKECCYLDFVKVICATYGAGIMDTFFDRDSPSWWQVWFTAEEVTAEVQHKGYSLTVSKAKSYLRKLLEDRRKLIEERTSIERGTEYRRVRLWYIFHNNETNA